MNKSSRSKSGIIATILASLAILLVVVIALLPTVIRFVAIDWLEKHGVEQAEIVNVDLNPFTGTFAIDGLKADDGLSINRLSIDIDWWPMWSNVIDIRSFELNGVKADLHQSDEGNWQLSTIKPDAPESPDVGTVEGKKDKAWQVTLNQIAIEDVRVNVSGGSVAGEAFDASMSLDALKLALKQAEASGGQWLDLELRTGSAAFGGMGYNVTNGSIKLNGGLFLPALGTDIAAGLKLKGARLDSGDFSFIDAGKGIQLLSVDSVNLNGINVSGLQKADFDTLELHEVILPTDGDDTLGKIGTITLKNGKLDISDSSRLQEVTIADMHVDLQKLKSGELVVLDALAAGSKAPEKGGQVSDTKKVEKSGQSSSSPPSLVISSFTVAAGSSFSYRDESLFPPFGSKIEVEKFTFSPVDLSGKQSGKLDVQLKLNKNGSLAVEGDITPSAEDPKSNLKLTLRNFDMPGLTGFVETDFGQAIKTGQMDLQSDIKVASKKIDAKNKLTIRKLELEKAKQPGKAEKGLGMPVDMALDMLRDSRGDIVMDVPVSGRLDDPNINAGDVINKALVSAMSGGVMTYAKLALQPYGAILMAAEFAVGKAQKAAKPKLTPIHFGERSSSLDADMVDYADKIAALMKEKDFRLQICGVATRNEGGGASTGRPRILDDDKLLQLAENRSDIVMNAIQGHGISADRLFNCRPAIDEKMKEAVPRVDMILD